MSLAAVVSLTATLASPEATQLHYDLKAGDHLVYRQTLRRRAEGPEVESETRAEWTTHLVVTGEEGGRRIIGFQRNRTAAELIRYREKGRNRIEEQRAVFASRLPSPRFAQANRLTDRGEPELPWSALRESASELLPALHEIEWVPSAPVRVGDSWKGTSFLGLTFRARAWEQTPDGRLLRVEASGWDDALTLRYWFSPESGGIARIEFEGAYPSFGATVHETLSIELLERRRGEDLRSWAADADVRQGVLAALLVSNTPVDLGWLYGLLAVEDPAFQRQILTLGHGRRLPPPAGEMLASLLESDDPRLRVLAVRVLERAEPAVARPLVDRALQDTDAFVRAAAKSWVTAHESGRSGSTPVSFPREATGTTFRAMTAPGFEGWLYVVHLPEDYRGDEPFPLLISLSGGPGRAMLGLPGTRNAFERLGYIVLFPEAADLWWSERSTGIVAALLDEAMRRFNVDTNRVYVSGSSNGGTGAFLYATLWPHRLAAAVSFMGAGVHVYEREPPLPANLDGLPLLLVHGDKDPIIPMRASRDTAKQVQAAAPRAAVELKILPGRQHDINLGNDEGLGVSFLERHVRDPFPRRVTLAVRSLAFPRRAWVEVLRKKNGVAELQGEIDSGNAVRLKTRNVESLRLLLRGELFPDSGPLRITWNDKLVFEGPLVEDRDLLLRSAQASADPYLGWSMEVPLDAPR